LAPAGTSAQLDRLRKPVNDLAQQQSSLVYLPSYREGLPKALLEDHGALGGVSVTAAPTLTGTAEANSTVTISVDRVVVGTTQATSSGAWSYALPARLLKTWYSR